MSPGTHLPPDLASVHETMAQHRANAEALMAQRLRMGVDDGDLSSDIDVLALAAFYNSVTRGMAVQARDGCGTQKLRAIADVAMRAWPGQKRRGRPARPRRAPVA